jgi:hypothetical protein
MKTLLYTTAFFIISILSIVPSTSKAQSYIDEDFLTNLDKNTQSLWAVQNNYFQVTKVPEKYKDESGVIIGYKRDLSIDKKSSGNFFTGVSQTLVFYENTRFKILLNDRSAVQKFSEVYFRYISKEDGFSARVIKSKDGAIRNVPLDRAVKVSDVNSIPLFFKSFFDQEINASTRYYKVPIADVEPGDIVEYVSITQNTLALARKRYIEFSPQYEVAAKYYPSLFTQISIETDNKSFFKSAAFNGAPKFVQETSENKDFFKYVYTDLDRPIEKDINFIDDYKVYPYNKFQVIYSNKNTVAGSLTGERGKINTSFSKEELARKAWEDFEESGTQFQYPVSMINGYVYESLDIRIREGYKILKKAGAKQWSDEEYITKAYYYVRNKAVNSDNYLADQEAAFMFSRLLLERDIKSDLVISTSRHFAQLKDVLFANEIKYVIRVNGKYYFNPTDHSNTNDLVESLLGTEAYIIETPDKKTKKQVITPVVLPNLMAKDNTQLIKLDVALSSSMKDLSIKRTSAYKGILKNKEIFNALRYTDYVVNDYQNYNGEDPEEKMKRREQEEYQKLLARFRENNAEQKKKFITNDLQNEYSRKVELKKFNIVNAARTLNNDELKFSEEFELFNMTRKAGKKLLVNITSLMGGQLQIKEDERARNHDIDVSYGRTLQWEIQFTPPTGYTVAGISELNTNISNEIGQFTSTAVEKDGKVIINITKQYKQDKFPKAKWNDMLNFADAAYNFSYKYLVLKPKQ